MPVPPVSLKMFCHHILALPLGTLGTAPPTTSLNFFICRMGTIIDWAYVSHRLLWTLNKLMHGISPHSAWYILSSRKWLPLLFFIILPFVLWTKPYCHFALEVYTYLSTFLVSECSGDREGILFIFVSSININTIACDRCTESVEWMNEL